MRNAGKLTATRPIEILELIKPLGTAQRWRIDWLGDVHKPRLLGSPHTITVFFSPMWPGFKGLITDPAATDSSKQVAVELGVGYLPELHIGAVFFRGQKVPLPPSQINRVRLKIIPDHFRFVPMNGPVDRFQPGKQFTVVAPWEFKVGSEAYRQAASSQNVILSDAPHTDESYVAIPSIEVARFFFCGSSLLSRHLFLSGWDDLILWSQCNTENMPREVVVGLRTVPGLDRSYARHLAYAVVDPLTRECLREIPQALQETRTGNFGRSAMQCRFPASGEIEIEAEAIQTPANTQRGVRFFITRLLKCYRSIPFEQCLAWPQLHPQQGDNWDDPNLMPMHLPKKKVEADVQVVGLARVPTIANLDELTDNGQAGDDLGPPTISADTIDFPLDEDRFPGLESVPTSLANKERQKYRNLGKERSKYPIQGLTTSTGSPRGSRPVAPAELRAAAPWLTDPGLRMLSESAPFLEEFGYTVIQLPVVYLSRFASSEEQKKVQWAWISTTTDNDGYPSYRSRLLLALLITSTHGACLVAEIERGLSKASGATDPRRHFVAGFKLKDPDDAVDELEVIASNVVHREAWPKFDTTARLFELHSKIIPGERAKHQNITNAQELAHRIYKSILVGLNI